MNDHDMQTIVRFLLGVGAVYAAFNWKTLDDDIRRLIVILGSAMAWCLPPALLGFGGFGWAGWIALGYAIFAAAVRWGDDPPPHRTPFNVGLFILAGSLLLLGLFIRS